MYVSALEFNVQCTCLTGHFPKVPLLFSSHSLRNAAQHAACSESHGTVRLPTRNQLRVFTCVSVVPQCTQNWHHFMLRSITLKRFKFTACLFERHALITHSTM